MLKVLYILLGLSLLAVVFTLLMGGKSMLANKDGDRGQSNTWMWRRIWAQATALILLFLTYWVKKNGG